MIVNGLVILFLVGMAYWWGFVQGMFSAVLHLLVVIVAGALALALWEPLVNGILLELLPHQAWGIGLIAPFALILLVFRIAIDKFVPGNMQFSNVINMVGGGAAGFLAGVLTTGLTLIGLGFLSFGASMVDHQPMKLNDKGQSLGNPGDGLVIPVNSLTAGFYRMLSNGTFYSGHPMQLYRPDLARDAVERRIKVDPFASIVATKSTVNVMSSHFAVPLPITGLDQGIQTSLGPFGANKSYQMVVVDTVWQAGKGAFDADSTLRIAPTQVRLIAWEDQDGWPVAHSHPPVGVRRVKRQEEGETRTFYPFNIAGASAIGVGHQTLGWVFVIPKTHSPVFITQRGLRFVVPTKVNKDPLGMVATLGSLDGKAILLAGVGENGGPKNGKIVSQIEVTDELPFYISKNFASGLTFQDKKVHSGNKLVNVPKFISTKNRLNQIYTPNHMGMVRIMITLDQAQALHGRVEASTKMEKQFYLEDSVGEKHLCVGYVKARPTRGDRHLLFNMVRPDRLHRGSQLPILQMEKADELYLYFIVPRGKTIRWYRVGEASQEVELEIPKK